ncbi:MAG: family 1 encapsulin nanocompartment shell protein [Solirubrobacteraceae bacterium]
MNHLLRSHAPISDAGWKLLDEEARQRLAPALAARRLVDFAGPRGWDHSASNLGRTTLMAPPPGDGVTGRQRRVLALVEARADFEISREELRDADRGAPDTDLSELDRAAYRIAVAENVAVFNGWSGAIVGVTEASPHDPVPLGDPAKYPNAVATALERLLNSSIAAPFALALGDDAYEVVIATAEHGGYPLIEHLRGIIGGPIVWAPGVRGAVLVSQRGGDFLFDCGEDLSIGYDSHDEEVVRLYLEESFSFIAATPEAAIALLMPAD